MSAELVRVSGALVEAAPLPHASLYELVHVGRRSLLGEVIRITGATATIQVFEDTNGLALGEPVVGTGNSLSAELGPGLLGSVLDGVGRPLTSVARELGDFIRPGTRVPTLDASRRWSFKPAVQSGTEIHGGDILGMVDERGCEHRVLAPPGANGVVRAINAGSYSVGDAVGALEDGTPIVMVQRWPVRMPRPIARRTLGGRPFITGQRVFDFLFPVEEGGTVAVPGGFGTGKTVIEQSLAKYADADVIVYIGCGERGNEMAEVLRDFQELIDPRSGRPMMDRAVLVVNTSNMPVAARESSIYLGMTIAEYYRDMGYRVAVMADSLSRWAEALREIAARLQEMPGEEGYPTYLGNRMSKLYERAGRVIAAGSPERIGSVTFISAISPPGGDFSEPVTQASLRVSGALWALDPALAHQRQFPAVDWETSYTAYEAATSPWFEDQVGTDWASLRREVLELLDRDRNLREIAGLVGLEALEDDDRVTLEVARAVREVVIGQSAFDPADAFSSVRKTNALATAVLALRKKAREVLAGGGSFESLDWGRARHRLSTLRASPASSDAPEVAEIVATVDGALTGR
jgi:V/A-type H+/Na+-transporting ATPase subunit A